MENTIKNFYDLDAWKKSHAITLSIYQITKGFPKDEIYGISSQIRRATSSIGANIAEGFERYHYKDRIKFYYQARGSSAEVQNFLFLAKDLKYISEVQRIGLHNSIDQIRQILNGLIRATEKLF